MKCETCDKIGHTSETCRAHLKCDYCGWQGHTIDICRKLQKANSTGKKPDQRERKNFSSKVNHTDANTPVTSTPFTLIAEQYYNLMTLLIENKSNSMANHVGSTSSMSDYSGKTFYACVINKEMCWILDTGATYHMVYSADLLTTKSCVTNRNIHLPNGAIATVTHIGSIHFSNFILNDVLCVPSFN